MLLEGTTTALIKTRTKLATDTKIETIRVKETVKETETKIHTYPEKKFPIMIEIMDIEEVAAAGHTNHHTLTDAVTTEVAVEAAAPTDTIITTTAAMKDILLPFPLPLQLPPHIPQQNMDRTRMLGQGQQVCHHGMQCHISMVPSCETTCG